MTLARAACKRAGSTALLLFGITVMTFALERMLPGDPARLLAGPRASAAAVAAIRHSQGLDRPLWHQYLTFIRQLARGDLGMSIVTRRPVIEDIVEFAPATLELVLFTMLIGSMIGIAVGVTSAVRRGGLLDIAARSAATLACSLPDFWVAIVFQMVFFSALSWLPFGGRLDAGVAAPTHLTGIYTLDALLHGDLVLFGQALEHLILPSLVLMLPLVAVLIRFVRASMLEVLHQDYIRTAKAKGAPPWRLYVRHALRNALLPVITVMGLELGFLLSGAVFVELVFSWPGLGRYTGDAVLATDYGAIMGITIVVSIAYILINAVVDVLYTVLDPRARTE
jgi:ABC-type dipeptide/oligopeptide/nickel transport system permease component